MFIRSKMSDEMNSDHNIKYLRCFAHYYIFLCDHSQKVVGPVLMQWMFSLVLYSPLFFYRRHRFVKIIKKTEMWWRISDQLCHLRSKLSNLIIRSTFLFADVFNPLLFALLLPFTSNLSAAISFSCHLKAIWISLCLNFCRHSNENGLRLSLTHGWEFCLRGFECKEKNERQQNQSMLHVVIFQSKLFWLTNGFWFGSPHQSQLCIEAAGPEAETANRQPADCGTPDTCDFATCCSCSKMEMKE